MNDAVSELLARGGREYGAAAAILAEGRAPLSYAALADHARATATSLAALGIGRGDRVAMVIPNGPEAAVAFVAIASCAIAAPLNPAYREAELDFYLGDLNARALIMPAGFSSPALAVAERRGIPVVRLVPDLARGAGSFELAGAPRAKPRAPAPVSSGDVALVLHTSGTTSRPKQVPLTHKNLCASARNIARTLALSPADRCLSVMPLFHIHGLIGAVLASLAAGASIACTPGFVAPEFFGWLERFAPTWYTAVPTMHDAIVARATREQRRPPVKLRFVRSSSSALAPSLMADLERLFEAPVIEAYGMTEASHQMSINPLPPRTRKPGSVGVAGATRVSIIDSAGQPLPAHARGEVAILGDAVTDGYVDNPAANAEAFAVSPDGERWFRTGDQGYLDDDGYLFLTGRLKELINRGGEKIVPREIDEALLEHPAVAQVVTFAVPDPRLGEDIAAAVVLRAPATALELRELVARRLAPYKVPRQIIFLDELPKGATGKLQRIGLAERLGVRAVTDEAPAAALPSAARDPELELSVTALWQAVLGLPAVALDDNFFTLGGDSILATQLLARAAQQFDVEISLPAFFETPTVAAQVVVIAHHRRRQDDLLSELETTSDDEAAELLAAARRGKPEP